MSTYRGDGKVAIVTGGTYGIGRAITMRLAEENYHVVAFGLNSPQIDSTAVDTTTGTLAELEKAGLSADVFEADVSVSADVERVARFALDKFGKIDALVNNAAIRPIQGFLDTDEETFNKTISVNLTGMFLMSKAVVPHMIEAGGGTIVNIGSGSGYGRPGLFAYGASKGGVFGLSSAMAYDLKPMHVRVNVIVPSGGLTGMTEGDSVYAERMLADAANNVAGRIMEPRDTASAVAFLLSDDADQITGAVLNVGNFYAQGGGGQNRSRR